MNVRQQVGRPTSAPQLNGVWRIKRYSQRLANQLANQQARLVFEAPVVASVALTEKTRYTSFTESNL